MSAFVIRNLSFAFAQVVLVWSSLLVLVKRSTFGRRLSSMIEDFSVAAADIAAIDFKRRRSRVIRYALKCALHPQTSLDWIRAIYESNVGGLIGKYPQLLLKPHRPYINNKFSFTERAKLLLMHYELAFDTLPQSIFSGVLCGKRFTISELTGKPGKGNYLITLERANELGREGELCFALRKESTDEAIYRLIFSFGQYQGSPTAYVGCLQGPRDFEAKTLISDATRALHGIRPKNLVVDLLYAFAYELGIQRICGISSNARVCQGRAVRNDYDSFWRELNGELDSSGFFVLPQLPNHRNACDVPSSRRSEYLRRHQLRNILSSDLRQWIDRCQRLEYQERRLRA